MNIGNKILYVLCGIAIVTGVIIYLEASGYQKNAKVAMGVVANSGITYYDIKYLSDDNIERTYKGIHSSKGRKYHDGDPVKVFYRIDDPDKSRISDGVRGGKLILFWSFIMVLFNTFSVYHLRKKNKTEKDFKTTGRKVEAQILRIDFDLSLTVLKAHPYFIDCKWVDPITGREYTHTIKYVWTDPKTLLAGRNSIDVYIDRNDPEKYYMDIAFLGDTAM